MSSFRPIFAAVLSVLVAAGSVAHAAPATRPADGRMETAPPELQDIGIDEKSGSTIPLDLVFVDETGKPVKLEQYFHHNRPVVMQLSYFGCPMLCTLVSNGLVESLNSLTLTMGQDFEVINVSFDPQETSDLAAMKKKSFLDAYNRPAGAASWHFLTGKRAQIEQLTRAVGFKYKWVEQSRQFSHPAALMILTPDGKLSRYLYGVKYDPRTLRLSLVEAGQGKIGTTVDRILLTCFHYDAYAGKYTATAMGIMRIAGVLTVIAIGAGISIAVRRESRTKARHEVGDVVS